MWLQQAIADFNAAKHFIKCTKILTEQGNASKVSRSSDEKWIGHVAIFSDLHDMFLEPRSCREES